MKHMKVPKSYFKMWLDSFTQAISATSFKRKWQMNEDRIGILFGVLQSQLDTCTEEILFCKTTCVSRKRRLGQRCTNRLRYTENLSACQAYVPLDTWEVALGIEAWNTLFCLGFSIPCPSLPLQGVQNVSMFLCCGLIIVLCSFTNYL